MKPVRFSNLRLMAKSPAHYRAALDGEREDTLAMRLGRLVHALVLGGDYLVWDGTRRGKEWDRFAEENAGREIVTASELAQAEPVAAAVSASELAAPLLDGAHEQTIEWEIGGRKCQGRLDVLNAAFITDLKSTTNAEPEWFSRHGAKMGYHAQLAWYADGAKAAGLVIAPRCYVVAVEMKPPHVVTCLELTPHALDMGRRAYRLWWERLMVCERSDYWPGYVEGIAPLDVPEDETLWIDGEEVAA